MTHFHSLLTIASDSIGAVGHSWDLFVTSGAEWIQNPASAPASAPGEFGKVVEWLTQLGYVGMISILVLCGLGLPVPEEVTLIGSGYVSFLAEREGAAHPNWILSSVVCVVGILAGDSIVYCLGRRFGNSLLKLPIIKHELTPTRLAKFDKLFDKYGDRAIFFSRFIMGVRLASYFVAGRQKMPYFKFILLDLGGALLSGPTSVWFGYHFGEAIESAFGYAAKSNKILIIGLVAIVIGMLIFTKFRSKKAKPSGGDVH